MSNLQVEVARVGRYRVMAMDSAYQVSPDNTSLDVVVNASYCGVLPARFIARHRPKASISVDCAVGPGGASIAGLWYLEALNIPAAVADVQTVLLGDGVDLFENGRISFCNRPALDCGVNAGMQVSDAAIYFLNNSPGRPDAEEITNRKEVFRNDRGRAIVCLDSIAFGVGEDQTNVLVTAGHSGRSALPYFLKIRPWGFICSDGGMGRNRSGVTGMIEAGKNGIPGAAVDARFAKMGDGVSSYEEGIITAANDLAVAVGITEGMRAVDAARKLVDDEHLAWSSRSNLNPIRSF